MSVHLILFHKSQRKQFSEQIYSARKSKEKSQILEALQKICGNSQRVQVLAVIFRYVRISLLASEK